jgi:hypothetical protein
MAPVFLGRTTLSRMRRQRAPKPPVARSARAPLNFSRRYIPPFAAVGAIHISERLTVDVGGLLPTQSDFQTGKSSWSCRAGDRDARIGG